MDISALVTIVLPIFAFIILGYLTVATGVFSEQTGDALSDFVFTIAVPMLLFRALGTFQWPEISPLPIWTVYFGAAAVAWAAGTFLTERLFAKDARAGVIGGVSSGYANLVLVGVPLFSAALGDAGLVVGFVLISVHLPITMFASAVLIGQAERRDEIGSAHRTIAAEMRRTLGNLARSPLIIAMLAGLAFRLTGLELSGIPRDVIDRMSDVAVPLALVSLGMALRKHSIGANLAPALVLSALKLVAMPAVAYAFAAHLAGLPRIATAVVTLGAGLPTGINAYIIANRFQTGHSLASNAITITTAASVLSLTFWLGFLGL